MFCAIFNFQTRSSANGEAFTHNVDKQKHKYKKKEDWVWDYLIRRSVISAERK